MAWTQRFGWPAQLSTSALGLILCTVGLLGLALLLLPELSSANLSTWSQSLDRALEDWFLGKLGQQPQRPSSQLATQTAKTSQTLPQQGHWDKITTLAISPDSQILASGSNDFTIKIWNLPTGKLLTTLSEHHEPIVSTHISADGKSLITSSLSGKLLLWDLKSLTLLGNFINAALLRPEGGMRITVTNPQAQVMASSDWGGIILVYHNLQKK